MSGQNQNEAISTTQLIVRFLQQVNSADDPDEYVRQITNGLLNEVSDIFQWGNLNTSKKSFKSLKKMEKESVAKQDNDKNCAICLDKLNEVAEIPEDFTLDPELNTDIDTLKSNVVIMPCKHRYHYFCLAVWLQKVATCPTCRHEVKTDAEIKKEERRQTLEELHNSMFS